MCEFVVKTIIDECEMPGVSCIVPFSLTNEEESVAYRGLGYEVFFANEYS